MSNIIFFGNGPLANFALPVLQKHHQVIFHAHDKADLPTVAELKSAHPDAYGVLASFGVIIKSDLLKLFAPTGILNLHPSKLPKYRGPSPIESAILAGDDEFTISIMQLVEKMDAGPIYHQATFKISALTSPDNAPSSTLPFTKESIYYTLATAGADWLVKNLEHLTAPTPQDGEATYTKKLDKSLSPLDPKLRPANILLREIIAFSGFPKSTYIFTTKNNQPLSCIIHSAHLSDSLESPLSLKCADGSFLTIDTLQPAGRNIMDAKSFINGYLK